MTEREVFLAALEIKGPAERQNYLQDRLQGDEPAQLRVLELLQAAAKVGDFLEAPAVEATVAYPSQQAADLTGTTIGSYKLLQKLGEGGMGTVWVAEQEQPVKRRVALKLVKAGMDSAQVIRRFEAERQALALMDHTNIAKVLDAGTTDQGRPYFVMELVKGVPITRYCDEVHASIETRLELFVQVCSAVQHAHQKGIIHRDIKPSNILIAMQDGKPVPKVIDFGVAKALHSKLADKTMYTEIGQIIGTLEYMAPEQAELSAMDIDTRADIYALGVLLYELLTGSTPITRERMKSAAFAEVIRLIKEEDPPKPSTRLSESKDSLASVASLRRTDPKHLSSELRGELDWVVLKALEKDRTRRYETANGLARDIQRYLADEMVEARPPSAGYRLRKLVRRNRGQVIAASLLLLALLAGIAGTTFGLIRAERSAAAERIAKNDAEEKKALAEQNEKKATAAAEKERKAREQETTQRARAEKAYARTADVLDSMVSEVTGDSLATQKTITAEQKKFLTEVLTYYQEFAGQKADDEKTRRRTAQAALRVGLIESRLGRTEESAAAFRKACDGFAALAAEFPTNPEHHLQLARSQNGLGAMLAGLGKRPEAEEQFRQALAILEKLAAEFPAVPEHRRALARSQNGLGVLLRDLGKRAEAEEQYRKALAIREKLAAEFPTVPEHRQLLANSHNSLGALLADLGKRPEAEEQYRKALAIQEKLAAEFPTVPDHRGALARSHNNLGLLLVDLGKQQEAVEQNRKALAISEKLTAEFPAVPEHRRDLAASHLTLGLRLADLGKRAEAEEQHRKALAIFEKLATDFPAVPQHRQELATSHYILGLRLADLGKRAEAEEQYRKALAIGEKLAAEFPAVPLHRQELAGSHNNLGLLLAGLGKRPEAEEQYRQALAIRDKLAAEFPAVPGHRKDLARSHYNLGILLGSMGKRQEAEEQNRKGLVILEKLAVEFPAVPQHRQDLATSHNSLGLLLAGLGKRPEAEAQYRQALVIQEKLAVEFPNVPAYGVALGGSYCNLGNLVRDGGRASDSLAWFAKAIRTLAPIHEQFPHDEKARQFLRNSHSNRSLAHDRLHQYAEAILDWDKAIELSPQSEQPRYRASRATSRLQAGQVAEAVAEVAELTKSTNWNADQWYNFACVHAVASGKLADQKDELARRSVELLQRAVQAGWRDAAHMKQDTDLDPLRNRDDFKKLLAELEKKP